jgi:hypothetical protein
MPLLPVRVLPQKEDGEDCGDESCHERNLICQVNHSLHRDATVMNGRWYDKVRCARFIYSVTRSMKSREIRSPKFQIAISKAASSLE